MRSRGVMNGYKVQRNTDYDFPGASYNSSSYPSIHKYPAMMIPQLGIEILRELGISKGKLLDPYCGSGSSFACGLECGIRDMSGYDLNPLAILISRVRFAIVNPSRLREELQRIKGRLASFQYSSFSPSLPGFPRLEFWFPKSSLHHLGFLRQAIRCIQEPKIRDFFLIPFSETLRQVSHTRKNEFKLYREKNIIQQDKLFETKFPEKDSFGFFFRRANRLICLYEDCYFPKLKELSLSLHGKSFEVQQQEGIYDVVLTSPPYGDSRTTVAYGQFSRFTHEWLDLENASSIDNFLMGGRSSKKLYDKGWMQDFIRKISEVSKKRAMEVSAFYFDLEESISKVAKSLKQDGWLVYVVSNRTVKEIKLPTDQFVAWVFEQNGLEHYCTYQRKIGNKSMPLKNSSSNIP